MREYKFRVWDKKKNRMLYLSPNDTILFKNSKCTVWKENQYDEIEECCCCETFNDVIPMLYSGLKDKNGKEIYDGDIVRQRRFLGWSKQHGEKYKDIYGVVRFEYGHFTCGIVDHTLIDWDKCEVVGNIHENPELLKEVEP